MYNNYIYYNSIVRCSFKTKQLFSQLENIIFSTLTTIYTFCVSYYSLETFIVLITKFTFPNRNSY